MYRVFILLAALTFCGSAYANQADEVDTKPAVKVEFDRSGNVEVCRKQGGGQQQMQQQSVSKEEVTFETASSDFTPFNIGLIVAAGVAGAGLGVYGKFKNETSK